jgi:outer membrane protein TolC
MNKTIRRQKTNTVKSFKLRKGIFYLSFVLMACSAFAQNDKNASTYHRTNRDSARLIDVREKLVQLALQNSDYEIVDRQLNKSVYELEKAKGSWLSPVQVSGNLNEFSIKQHSQVPNFFPKYNFGVTVPLDLFTTKKNEVKIARENVLISQAQRNQKAREIRAEVLTRYEDYMMYKEKLDIQARITQDQHTIYLTKEKDYQDGIINQEEDNKYYTSYSENRSRISECIRNVNVSKLLLEQMIGIPLEQALNK